MSKYLQRPVLQNILSALTGKSSRQSNQLTPQFQRLATNDRDAWRAHWKSLNQPWRTEPEIDVQRQKVLAQRRAIAPNVGQGIYPFKGMKLERADVEWLLATHENGRGPIDWSDESQRERSGLDLRGADLHGTNLSGLPLAQLRGGLTLHEWSKAKDQTQTAAVHLEGADLNAAHLEGAVLIGVHMEKCNFRDAHLEQAVLRDAHLEQSNLCYANLEQALLIEAHLERTALVGAQMKSARLINAHLEGADLRVASLERARMFGAFLEKAYLRTTHLEEAELAGAHLEGAILYQAHLEHARLDEAHLEGADLRRAHLEGTDLSNAHLEGKSVSPHDLKRVRFWLQPFAWPEMDRTDWKEHLDFPATLSPADLREAFFDGATRLNGITLATKKHGCVLLVDVNWGSVNLAVLGENWAQLHMLGDEQKARQKRVDGKMKDKAMRLDEYEQAVRATRQLAVTLQTQGLNEIAAHFAYRAQMLQNRAFWFQMIKPRTRIRQRLHALGAWLFSWFLFLLAGYGYNVWRSFFAYLLVISLFMTIYLFIDPHLTWGEALVVSMTAFHGRGFSPNTFSPGDPLSFVSAAEAFVGLIIEATFIAALTQRFFGR